MSLSSSEVDQLLRSEEITYIATTMPDGSPHVVPIWFIYSNGSIFFTTSIESKKFMNIMHKNAVALCFGHRKTYIAHGSVSWRKPDKAELPMHSLMKKKYGDKMKDHFINSPYTRVFKVKVSNAISWH